MNNEYVIFKLENESYAIGIENVQNIEKVVPITRVPFTKAYVKGVINLRGIIIPVIDARTRFSLPEVVVSDDTRIIIVTTNETAIGLIVDASSEVLSLSKDDIEPAPSLAEGQEVFVKSLGKHDGRIIMIVDLETLLDLKEFE